MNYTVEKIDGRMECTIEEDTGREGGTVQWKKIHGGTECTMEEDRWREGLYSGRHREGWTVQWKKT